MNDSSLSSQLAETAGKITPAVVGAEPDGAVGPEARAQAVFPVQEVVAPGEERDQVALRVGGVALGSSVAALLTWVKLVVAEAFAADEVELAAVELDAAARRSASGRDRSPTLGDRVAKLSIT